MKVAFLDTGQTVPFPSEPLDAMVWIENLNDITATVPDDFPVFPVLIRHNVLYLAMAASA
jgi:hypothetical protein